MSPYEGQGSAKGLKARDSILFYQDRGTVPPDSPGVQGDVSTRSRGVNKVLGLLTPGQLPAVPAGSPPAKAPHRC